MKLKKLLSSRRSRSRSRNPKPVQDHTGHVPREDPSQMQHFSSESSSSRSSFSERNPSIRSNDPRGRELRRMPSDEQIYQSRDSLPSSHISTCPPNEQMMGNLELAKKIGAKKYGQSKTAHANETFEFY